MSLTGVLSTLVRDPTIADLRAGAGAAGRRSRHHLRSRRRRAADRPAGSPAEPTGAGRPVLAVTATGREAEDLAGALRCFLPADVGRGVPGLGDPAARAAQPAQRHRRPAAGGAAPAGPPGRRRRGAPAGSPSSSRRCGPCCSRWSRASATSSRSPCRPATRCRWRRSSSGWSPRRTSGPTWSSGAASSRCAAASSTSSRRPRSTRCGSSSSATRSRRSAGSRSPTSAAWRSRRDGLWAPPCREVLLTDAVRARAAALAARLPGRRRPAGQGRRGHRRRGHGVAGARCWSTAWSRCSTSCPRAARSSSATPSGSAPGPTTWSRRAQEFLQASWVNAAAGNAVPGRPAAGARHRVVLDARPDPRTRRSAAGVPVVVDRAVRRRRRAGRRAARTAATRSSTSTCSRSRATAARPSGPSPTSARWLRDGWRVVVVTEGHGPGQARRRAAGRARRCPAGVEPAGLPEEPEPGVVHALTGSLGRGFLAPGLRLAVLTEADLTGSTGADQHPGHAQDAVAAAQRDRPAGRCGRATTSCTSSTASASSWRWPSAPCRARPASTC